MSADWYTQAPPTQSFYDQTYFGPELSDSDPFSASNLGNWDAYTCANPNAEAELQALMANVDDSILDSIMGSWDFSSVVPVQPTMHASNCAPQSGTQTVQVAMANPSQVPQHEILPLSEPAPQPTAATSHRSTSTKPKAGRKTISAIDLLEANVRYNPDFRTSGLLPWDEIDFKGGMAREAQMEACGIMPFTPITWEEALQYLGKQQFMAYYYDQVDCATRNNWSLAPLPDWISSYCFGKQAAPSAVTSQAVAQKLLAGDKSSRASSSRKAARAQRQSPYARP